MSLQVYSSIRFLCRYAVSNVSKSASKIPDAEHIAVRFGPLSSKQNPACLIWILSFKASLFWSVYVCFTLTLSFRAYALVVGTHLFYVNTELQGQSPLLLWSSHIFLMWTLSFWSPFHYKAELPTLHMMSWDGRAPIFSLSLLRLKFWDMLLKNNNSYSNQYTQKTTFCLRTIFNTK